MSSNSLPSLNSLIRHLMTCPTSSTNNVMDELMGSLESAVRSDACAVLRLHSGSGTALVLGGKDLNLLTEHGTGRIEVPAIMTVVSGLGSGQVSTVRGPFTDDPFLAGEGAKVLLLGCMEFGTERLVSLALRRSARNFTASEVERFLIISGIVNLMIVYSHELRENGQNREVDPLTGLGLYPAFHDTLEREISRSRRRSGQITVGILAMAGEERHVDGEPVPSGSTVLLVSETLKEQLRSFDTVIRYSFAEFALILPDIGGTDAAKVIQRVIDAVRSSKGKEPFRLNAGMSCYPEDGSTVERLIETAEAALNLAVKEDSTLRRWREG